MSSNVENLYKQWLGSLTEVENMPNWDNAESNFIRLFTMFKALSIDKQDAEPYMERAVIDHGTTVQKARMMFRELPIMRIKYSNPAEYIAAQQKMLSSTCYNVFFDIYPIGAEVLESVELIKKETAKKVAIAKHYRYLEDFPAVDLDDLPEILQNAPITYSELFKEEEDG